MDRIHYAGDSVLTGSRIAAALLDYADALAKVGTSATVEIPTQEPDGTIGRSRLLIGPASQLIADAEDTSFDELVDDVVVERLRRETAGLRSPGGPAQSSGRVAPEWYDEL